MWFSMIFISKNIQNKSLNDTNFYLYIVFLGFSTKLARAYSTTQLFVVFGFVLLLHMTLDGSKLLFIIDFLKNKISNEFQNNILKIYHILVWDLDI